jgi:predicted dehydrogenase
MKNNKLGMALVGLGRYSKGELGPALKQTEHCYLAGIVTGSEEKAKQWSKEYDVEEKNCYTYNNFDSIKDNPDIDIIYVVLPNAMHAEYVVRAAKAGKHVICEKPMAINVSECEEMIEACSNAGVLLSIGYRLFFDPYNVEMMRIGKEKVFGNIKTIYAEHGLSGVNDWRSDKALAGGGPLMDVGVYCVSACRYVTGMEPIAVTAKEGNKTDPEKFRDVEESLEWEMEFPGGIIAHCKSSYTEKQNRLRVECENGWAELDPAFPYRGIKGKTSEGKMKIKNPTRWVGMGAVNQQARQMDDFAMAVKENRATPVPGEMGMQDVKIMMAIYEAMRTGERVSI